MWRYEHLLAHTLVVQQPAYVRPMAQVPHNLAQVSLTPCAALIIELCFGTWILTSDFLFPHTATQLVSLPTFQLGSAHLLPSLPLSVFSLSFPSSFPQGFPSFILLGPPAQGCG